VQEKFRLEWTYHSNALEGNPLTLSETSFFIREGLTSEGRPLSAYLEAKNHAAALDFLEQIVREQTPLTEHLIKQYHAMLFEKIDYVEAREGRIRVEAGRYKTEQNHGIRLDGKIREFTDPLQVAGEMERLIEWYEAEKGQRHPIELAGMVHHRLASIHPFTDGNGRVSRLVMNTLLMQAGYTPAIIPVEEKQQYLEALQSADDGDAAPFLSFLERLVAKSLRLTLDVIEGREAFDFDDLSKMFRSVVEKTKAVEQTLGPAVKPPEVRSHETAGRIQDLARVVLREHVTKISTGGLPVQQSETHTVMVPPQWQNVTKSLQGGLVPPLIVFAVNSTERIVPSLRVTFGVLSGRNQVGLFGVIELGKRTLSSEKLELVGEKTLVGSIFFEDWDAEEVRGLVLDVLKAAYKAWGQEVERRNELIAQEEAELAKFRPPRADGGD
jgi:Fic family protein